MKSKFELINDILTEWNPIMVPEVIAKIEYTSYVPLILQNMHNETDLIECLDNIFRKRLGLSVAPEYNIKYKCDLQELAQKILSL